MRARFRVQMINNIGLEEVGIDGGGVFREFLSELIKTSFDPNRGFFMFVSSAKSYILMNKENQRNVFFCLN